MTEEIKNEEKNCRHGHGCEKFLLTILASFIGALIALCLFAAAIKPAVKFGPCPMMHQQQRFEAPAPMGMEPGRPQRGDFRPDAPGKHQRPDAPKPLINEAPKAQR